VVDRPVTFGSLAYALYGLADKFTVGIISTWGYSEASGGPPSTVALRTGPNLPISLKAVTGDAFGLAPAIEYDWKSNIGLLVGTRSFPAARNPALSIIPAIAINYVH
jgi:hypothetical protein